MRELLFDFCHCILLKKLDFKSKPYIAIRRRPLVRLAQLTPDFTTLVFRQPVPYDKVLLLTGQRPRGAGLRPELMPKLRTV